MQTKTIRPRRTAINHKNRFFLWGKKNGLDLAQYDLNSVDIVETKKVSSFKRSPDSAKKHNYIL